MTMLNALAPELLAWWERAPKRTRSLAMLGCITALPLAAAFGIIGGELIGIAGSYLAGAPGATLGKIIGGVGLSGGIVLRGALIGIHIEELFAQTTGQIALGGRV